MIDDTEGSNDVVQAVALIGFVTTGSVAVAMMVGALVVCFT